MYDFTNGTACSNRRRSADLEHERLVHEPERRTAWVSRRSPRPSSPRAWRPSAPTGRCHRLRARAPRLWAPRTATGSNLFNASGGNQRQWRPRAAGVRDSQFVGGGPAPLAGDRDGTGRRPGGLPSSIGAAQLGPGSGSGSGSGSGGASCGNLSAGRSARAIVPTRKTIFWKSSGEKLSASPEGQADRKADLRVRAVAERVCWRCRRSGHR